MTGEPFEVALRNRDHDDLIAKINLYLIGVRNNDLSCAGSIRETLTKLLPCVCEAQEASTEPDAIFIDLVITSGVRGLTDDFPAALDLWNIYYLESTPDRQAAKRLSISREHLRRLISRFGALIARQLWQKNHEMANPRVGLYSPSTLKQDRLTAFKTEYNLSPRQAEVLLAFCEQGPHVGRRTLAEKLYISEETLKTHCGEILKRMNLHGESMSEAVTRAQAQLKSGGLD